MSYLFSSESVSEGHPDKVADQISDALLDQFLAYDPESHCAIETFDTTGQVVIMGEVRSKEYIDLQTIARKTINKIGYTKAEYQFDGNSCGILTAIHEQSDDINRGVSRDEEENQGAGDQGMMFGYACNETENYMPVTLDLAHLIMRVLADIRKEGKEMTYLRPDSKSQVTIEYSDDNIPLRIDTIVVSTQHDQFMDDDEAMLAKIKEDVLNILMPRVKAQLSDKVLALFNDDIKYFVNPTGKFVIGGPHGDTGLTGRKIIVDTYGGKGAHGGGAFSGKDPSKVDRSAAYAARYVAKNIVANGYAKKCEISDKIFFTGLLPSSDDVREELLKSDIFVFPTKGEGLPRGVLEAMATGMPVVTTPVGGIPEVIEEEFLFHANDIEGFIGCLQRLMNNPEKMNIISAKNYEKSLEFRNDILQKKRNAFYRKLAALAK